MKIKPNSSFYSHVDNYKYFKVKSGLFLELAEDVVIDFVKPDTISCLKYEMELYTPTGGELEFIYDLQESEKLRVFQSKLFRSYHLLFLRSNQLTVVQKIRHLYSDLDDLNLDITHKATGLILGIARETVCRNITRANKNRGATKLFNSNSFQEKAEAIEIIPSPVLS